MLTGITFEEFLEVRVEEVEERAAKEKEAAVKKAEEKAKKIAEEKDRNFVMKLLRKNCPVEEIQELTEVPMDKILEIKNAIN